MKLPRLSRKIHLPEIPFKSAAHSEWVTARVGSLLAITFTVCFITGLISHAIQHPPEWFFWPSRPINLYRITQGVHVISGIASIPLLLAKLWSVFPKLFARPLIKSIPHAIERLSILLLSASAFFELFTGLFNVAQNYPWNFFFPPIHYAVAWIAFGSIVVHIAIKLPIIRRAFTRDKKPEPEHRGLTRRGFLGTTALITGGAIVATAGATVPFLRGISPLSWRSANKLPVNRSAAAAGVLGPALDPRWRLEVVSARGTKRFSINELHALPQTDAELPIACVEGWSQSAHWSGVSLPDLLRAAGCLPGSTVHVQSMDSGLYGKSTLPGEHTADSFTLLALRLDGKVLEPDHGYPCRIIAPNRPGVLQTKWVTRMEIQ